MYDELFIDSLFAALLVPFRGELVLTAMVGFGSYNAVYIYATVMAASVSGSMVNWSIGRFCIAMVERDPTFEKTMKPKHDRSCRVYNSYVIWLLSFSWVYVLGGILTLAGGFLKARFTTVLALVTLGKAAYYGYLVFG